MPSMFNTSFSLNLLSGSVGIFLFRNICIVKLIENLPNSFQISYCYFFFPPEKHYFSSAFKMLSLVVTCWVRWSPRWAWQCQPRRATGTAGRADFLGHLASTPPQYICIVIWETHVLCYCGRIQLRKDNIYVNLIEHLYFSVRRSLIPADQL